MSNNKRQKKHVIDFSTHCPSNDELEYYNKNQMFDKMERRLKDKTVENMVKDASVRKQTRLAEFQAGKIPRCEWDTFDRSVMFKIMVFTDVKTVFDVACKILMVQEFIMDSNFWQQKYIYDFPEIVQIFGCNLPIWWTKSWRSYYLFNRQIVKSIRRRMLDESQLKFRRDGITFNLKMIDYDSFEYTTIISEHFKPICIDFKTLLKSFFIPGNYILQFAKLFKIIRVPYHKHEQIGNVLNDFLSLITDPLFTGNDICRRFIEKINNKFIV